MSPLPYQSSHDLIASKKMSVFPGKDDESVCVCGCVWVFNPDAVVGCYHLNGVVVINKRGHYALFGLIELIRLSLSTFVSIRCSCRIRLDDGRYYTDMSLMLKYIVFIIDYGLFRGNWALLE